MKRAKLLLPYSLYEINILIGSFAEIRLLVIPITPQAVFFL